MENLDKELKNIFTKEENVPEQLTKTIQKTMNKKEKLKNKNIYYTIRNVAVAMVVVTLLGLATPNIYAQIKWNIEYKEFENRPVEYGMASIKQAMENGYEKNIDMEYVYHDNIGIKLSSIMITDDFFSMDVDFIFPKETIINTETFSYGYAVYDESKNVYGVREGEVFDLEKITKGKGYWKKLYREENIKYDKKANFPNAIGEFPGVSTVTTSKEGKIITNLSMSTPKKFPKSKKLYIRIFDIGYTMNQYDEENPKLSVSERFNLTDVEWKLEIEVPQDFYKRESIELKLAENVDGFELEKLTVTETGTNIIFKMDGFIDLVMSGKDMEKDEFEKKMDDALYITNEEGKRYSYTKNENGTYMNGTYKAKFDLNKSDLNQKLYLNFKMNDKQYKIELLQ